MIFDTTYLIKNRGIKMIKPKNFNSNLSKKSKFNQMPQTNSGVCPNSFRLWRVQYICNRSFQTIRTFLIANFRSEPITV